MWPVKFNGIEPQIERKHIYFFFQSCGDILRLFLKEDKSSATLYFDNEESANKAKALLQQPNKHHFRFVDLNGGPCKSFPDRPSRPINNLTNMDNEIESKTTCMFDILGNKIPTLSGDNGEVYVAISDLSQTGLRLFPNKPSKLVFNIQIQEYMRMYLQIQLYKFACKYNCNFNEGDKVRIISSVEDKINNQVAENNGSIPPQINQSNGTRDNRDEDEEHINTPLRRPKDINIASECPPIKISVTTTGNNVSVHNDTSSNTHNDTSSNTASNKNINVEQPLAGGSGHNKKNMNGYGQDRISTGFERKLSDGTMSQYSIISKTKSTEFDKNLNDDTTSQVSGGGVDLRRSTKSISVPLNKKIKVNVCFINENNPKIAFLHYTNTLEKLENINREVAAEATSGFNIQPSEGLICGVSNNSVWIRALVRSLDPVRVLLIDYGKPIKLRDNTMLRGLSESLQNEPWLAIRACKSSNSVDDVTLENNGTYIVEVTKVYDDGTHICSFSKLPCDDAVPKPTMTPQGRNFGMNLANAVTSTPKPMMTSKPPLKPIQPILTDDTLHHSTIVDELTGGMQVIVEFHFETYCKDNSVVAFICMDNMNDEYMEIVDKITNIASEYMSPYDDVSSIRIGELVAIKAKDDDAYYRCMVYKIHEGIYSVAKVDAGSVEDVDANCIIKLDDEIKKLPFLSCICIYSDLDDLKDEVIDVTFNVNSAKELSQEGSTYKIQGMAVKPWNPLVTHGHSIKSAQVSSFEPHVDEPCVTLSCATNEPKLQIGNIVRIINMDLTTRTFFCQTREMFTSYNKTILENIREAAKDCKPVKNPKENQVVIVKIGAVLYRGVINSISTKNISVTMVDTGGYISVSAQDIFVLDGSQFTNMKYCCAQFKLNGLETLEEEGLSFLNKCIQSKEKFTITEIKNAGISMTDSMGSDLLNRLNYMTSKPPGYWYRNLKHVSVPIGRTSLLFSYADIMKGELYFTVSDIDHRTKISELLTTLPEYCDSAAKYHPATGEICIAFCMGEWCRAHVLSANKAADEYDVFYMDFGNSEKIKSDIIRCLPDETYGQVVPLCTRFIIKDLREIYGNKLPPVIGEKVQEVLEMGQEYEIDILKQVENNTCLADIPVISKMLTNDDDF